MQRCPPAWYLAFNIFMWGVLLMAQAAAQNFAGLLALRILSGEYATRREEQTGTDRGPS